LAKDVSKNPWKFDAVDQYEGFGNIGEAAGEPVFQNRPTVDYILIESGATGGAYEVTDVDDGITLTGTQTLGANASVQISVAKCVDGVYINQFGSDGQILVFHGQDA
jgi:hypothetical protein